MLKLSFDPGKVSESYECVLEFHGLCGLATTPEMLVRKVLTKEEQNPVYLVSQREPTRGIWPSRLANALGIYRLCLSTTLNTWGSASAWIEIF